MNGLYGWFQKLRREQSLMHARELRTLAHEYEAQASDCYRQAAMCRMQANQLERRAGGSVVPARGDAA